MGEYLCIGDYICLATDNGLCIYSNQDRNRPTNIPNQHVVVFQVCIQNRYKLNKKYRKWLQTLANDGTEPNIKSLLAQSKAAANAEYNDNELEQKRQHGKRVRYGEIVQLKHVFTGKFVHMSTTQTSQIDKNYMKVSLHDFNAKNAQFRILPRYKVKSEGEVVQLYDQIVFESVKSPGHYFHASESHQIDYKSYGSELNLGVERSSFTLIGSFRETLEQERFVRHRPKSLSPSTSGITYWQIEAEHSILDGDVLRWEQQIRLRHMLTRQYLCIDSHSAVSLVTDPADPRTVFRLHSVLKEQDEIQYESYARIEHVLTGYEDYEKREFRASDNEEMSMYGLRWDGASTRKVSASGESMYDDAYTLQMVERMDVMNLNFVAGMVPFLFNLIQDFQNNIPLTAKKTHGIIAALRELKFFMTVENQPDKDRQKLMRNLRVIDLLVKLLQCQLKEGDEETHMIRIFKEAYDVLHAYMIGKSRKNALYFAKYIDFFQTQFTQKNYRFLDLLQVLCVCDGVAIPNNQTYITEKWLRSYKDSVFLTDRGQNINKRPNIVYVSTNNTQSWVTLHEFVNPDSAEFNHEQYDFLIHQLELFKALTYGRNDFGIHVITREFGYLTWEDAFLCITSDLLPDSIRAKYCELIIGCEGSGDDIPGIARLAVLRLLQHLVKFGYYSDIDDVRTLLTPLLSLLDGRHDVPFPKDKGKGYSKDGQKSVNKYRESGRFETSNETEASDGSSRSAFDISEEYTTEAMKKQREVLRELKEMFHASAIFEIDSTTTVLMDLSNYKYDIMVTKSLDILNKLYSSQSDMFRLAVEAQILLSQDSARVHREVQRSLPVLRRLSKQKLNDQQVLLMSEILDELAEFCHLPKNPHEPHFMNQNIMISHGVLDIVLDILSQEIEPKLLEDQYSGMKVIFKKTLYLLQLLIRENDNVQYRIFNSLDVLLDVQVVPSDLALALKEVFIANQATCLKVHPQQIKKIVRLAAEHQNNASEFLDLLNVLVKVEGLDLTIKRNQALVMKYIMQNFKKAAYVLDQPREARENILTNNADEGHLAYFAHLVDLLATCAEGENKFIESLCQTILPVDEILWVINHRDIDCNIKRPFIKFMMWVYMKPAENLIESGAADLQHHKQLWDFISTVIGEINQLTDCVKNSREKSFDLLKMSPSKSAVADTSDTNTLVHSGLFYILEGVMPFLEVFYSSFFAADKDLYPDEIFQTDSLSTALLAFSDMVGCLLTGPLHMKNLVASITAVVTASFTPKSILVGVMERFTTEMKVGDTKSAVRKGNMEYYAAELELNAKFNTFAQNCRRVHVGHNTVQQQLKQRSKNSKRGGVLIFILNVTLCTNLVKCFIDPKEKKTNKKYALTAKLLDQLAISAKKIRFAVSSTRSQEELDVLPHLARRSDAIARETLAFASIMLFNANREVQKSLLEYFFSTREEVFFMAVRDRMQVSTNSIKEKRALLAQHDLRRTEFMNNFGSFQTSLTLGRKALQKIQHYELRLKKEKMQGWKALSRAREPLTEKQRRKSKKKKNADKKSKPATTNGLSKDYISDRSNENLLEPGSPDKMPDKINVDYKPATGEIEMIDIAVDDEEEDSAEKMFAEMDESVADMLEYKDDGCIELVLKVLARICDGQHVGLQNYLREQPDNVKSFNIIGETAQFLNVVYSSINSRTVDLVIQLFNTLNEFCSGNQENREVIYNKKVIDYINFILRAGEIADCSPEKCHEMHQSEKPKLEDIVKSEAGYMQSAKSMVSLGGSLLQGVVKGPSKNALKESLTAVGFNFYLILARMSDIEPKLSERLNLSQDQVKAFEYYKKNSTSVEIVKDDVLQKVNFRVKNKILIRDEVKEKLKWNVDRSSPSNKIRELMDWTRDIMQDISYQRKILFNPIAIMFTKGWLLWNHLVTILSFAINILMLFTWNAKATVEDYERISALGNATNETFDWALLKDPSPEIKRIPLQEYTITMYILMGLHNLFSLFVLISYFLSNHPRFPTCAEITKPFRNCRNQEQNNDTDSSRNSEEKPSKLDVKFFSFTTFFYLLFLAMSVTGTWYHGYFFAFHLLNIVNNNQLLGGVIKAVTQNGVSLLWVAILGFIVIYIYSLVGFSLLRAYFAPGDYLYCSTLWQCTVTVIRYGLIGDMFEVVKQSEKERTFETFWPIVLYHVSFFIFITTIGLNIIFGIIVDTFSELRDLKWRAESDMKDTCFVCSRNSYDFEHNGKGFDYHVRNEHNMWSYIFFFIHLNDMKTSDYTAIELFVSRLLEQESYDFFPMNRALCLSSIDIDSTGSKIDDLLHQVTSIAQKQRDDEMEKKRKVEKLKQKRWQEKHRRFIFGIHHSTDDNELGEREPLIPQSGSSNDEGFSNRQQSGNMLSVSDDSEYYKEKRGSISLLQILEGLPDDKSSRASSKSRILSLSDVDSDEESDSDGSTGPAESYDLMKSREASHDRIDSIPEESIVVPVPQIPEGADGQMTELSTEPLPAPPDVDDADFFPTVPPMDGADDDDQYQSTRL
ncbi:ITPR1-like protein [Mya arenaria]|uniref:ITPR1-like protein n=1 Tax=Mya arenaria TaxID=6604 RepID=A0ABY7EUI8_MYAAR|nr:ITPR1-like protein [Mya arenaria]